MDLIVGLIAGALGKLIMPGEDLGGIIVTILLGIVGAFVGGFVVNLFGGIGATGLTLGRYWWLPWEGSYC